MSPLENPGEVSAAALIGHILAIADSGRTGPDVADELNGFFSVLDTLPCKTIEDAHAYVLLAHRLWNVVLGNVGCGQMPSEDVVLKGSIYLAMASDFMGKALSMRTYCEAQGTLH